MSKSVEHVSVPFLVEWTKYVPNGDTNKIVAGTFEFDAIGWDYDSTMAYAINRGLKACKRHGCQMISVTLKGTYNPNLNAIKTWTRKIIIFPELNGDTAQFIKQKS